VCEGGGRRWLSLGENVQGVAHVDDPAHVEEWTALIAVLADGWLLAQEPIMHAPRALFFGLGAAVVPRTLQALHPSLAIELVDLHPEVVDAAQSYFGLQLGQSCKATVEDARDYALRRKADAATYDVVVVDCFTDEGLASSVEELIEHLPALVAATGICIINTTWGQDKTRRGETASRLAARLAGSTDQLDAIYLLEASSCRNVLVVCHRGCHYEDEDWRRLIELSLSRTGTLCPQVASRPHPKLWPWRTFSFGAGQ